MNDTVLLDVNDGVAVLTLNRPAQKNALDLAMRDALAAAVPRVRDDAAIKALVLRGAGEAFCSGGDVARMQDTSLAGPPWREGMRALHRWFGELAELEKPVIAAVDGPAFGAGFSLALAADFIVATPRAKFCAVFGRMGLVPDLGCLFMLPRIVGLQRAKEIVFTTRVVTAGEAHALGIVFEVVPAEALQAQALELASRFRHAATGALGMAKNLLNQSFHLDRHAMAEMEACAQTVCRDSPEHCEAVQRFKDKKPPLFSWER
jgi:2-(1,2-epoxy-1,2-dihydrophenyl)acetyl-CoA isomerase